MAHTLRTSVSMSHLDTLSIVASSTKSTSSSDMPLKDNFRTLYERVQSVLRAGRRKEKRGLEISAPFDSKLVPVSIPGVTEEEIEILREQAAASRIGIAESIHSQSTPCLTLEIPPRRTRSPYARTPSPHSAVSYTQHSSIW
ncbi:hypothetical protein ESCO_002979 [Escovopsis weberi]|uniref:Uncharacterized protein n=1 Tax=Escovopsis weberi TaxID=150374 RepID=A0A0N0RT61_ESCWE|nr:hypothetical protein ESCO_002979 [Escovopsis weberi]